MSFWVVDSLREALKKVNIGPYQDNVKLAMVLESYECVAGARKRARDIYEEVSMLIKDSEKGSSIGHEIAKDAQTATKWKNVRNELEAVRNVCVDFLHKDLPPCPTKIESLGKEESDFYFATHIKGDLKWIAAGDYHNEEKVTPTWSAQLIKFMDAYKGWLTAVTTPKAKS
jgi:hypothetical protein